jgi:hypothetical protein
MNDKKPTGQVIQIDEAGRQLVDRGLKGVKLIISEACRALDGQSCLNLTAARLATSPEQHGPPNVT